MSEANGERGERRARSTPPASDHEAPCLRLYASSISLLDESCPKESVVGADNGPVIVSWHTSRQEQRSANAATPPDQ